VGAAAALVLFFLLLTFGRGSLLARDQLGDFYEAQARALFHGHLSVDPSVVSFEGFNVGGRTYMYQGPVPAILRMPLLLVTSRFDGRLTRVSMLLAYGVALAAIIKLGWRSRVAVRGDGPVGRFEAAMAGIVVFAAGASSLLFLGAKPWVYHEALLWGAALALASFAALVGWLTRDEPSWWGLVWAGVFAGGSLLSRPSVGLGPVLALGLVALWELWALRRPAARTRAAVLRVVGLAFAAGLPLLAYAAINQAKFDSPFKLPTDAQVLVSFDAKRRGALAANHGSLFGLKFAPSVAWQELRPDAVGFRREFPFLGFPSHRPSVIGDVVFAEQDWSSSFPASEPLLVVLAIVGAVVLIVPDRLAPGSRVRRVRAPVLGAAAGGAGVLVLGYMANRYLSDTLPLLLVTGLIGAAATTRWAESRRRGARRLVCVGAGVLALWGAWVNVAIGLQYQREVAPGAPGRSRAEWLEWQARLGPDPRFVRLPADAPLPSGDHIGRVAVIGDCGGLYRSTGGDWQPIEGSPVTGHFDLDVSLMRPVNRQVLPLLEGGTGRDARVAVYLGVTDGRASPVLTIDMPEEHSRFVEDNSFPLRPGASRNLHIIVDWRIGFIEIRDADADHVLLSIAHELPHVPVHVVAQPPLRATERPADPSTCKAIGAG
jgi:hypothetical protein